MHAILTVSGADHTGIIASIATTLAERDVNILDVSQTLTSGYFTMILRVDVPEDKVSIQELKDAMQDVSGSTGQTIHIQSEELFTAMNEV